jgi:hypothetical protein
MWVDDRRDNVVGPIDRKAMVGAIEKLAEFVDKALHLIRGARLLKPNLRGRGWLKGHFEASG